MSKFKVKNTEITVISSDGGDYISLTDMVRNQENNHVIIGNWLKNKDTIEYLGLWEQLNNPFFKLIEFDEFRKGAGTSGRSRLIEFSGFRMHSKRVERD